MVEDNNKVRLWPPCKHLCAVLIAIVATACTSRDGDKLVYAHLKRLADSPATDCGRVALGEDGTAANECAMAAIQKKSAFLVRYEVQGLDSRLVVGVAADDKGRVVVVKHDTEGWDPHELRPEDRLVDDNHVLVKPCDALAQLHKTERGYLSC